MVIGLLGAIGSGKSAIARLFVEAGAKAVDADRLAREELARPETRDRVAGIFGPEVIGPDSAVDRRALAARAFADRASLDRLNGAIHPPVRRRIIEEVRRHRHAAGNGAAAVLVLDVPLLAESPIRAECDALVFVDAPAEVRRRRLAERGWAPGDAERRETFQTPLEDKRSLCRWTVDNGGAIEEARAQVRRVLQEIEAGEDRTGGEMRAARVEDTADRRGRSERNGRSGSRRERDGTRPG
jgi:dephospho-CoA kinase